MLQQTQVKTVLPYWERWIQALPNIRALAEAGAQKIHKLWEGLGYYTRVRNMQRAAQIIVKEHDGEFPRAARPMDLKNLKVIAYVQNDSTGDILQAASIDLDAK